MIVRAEETKKILKHICDRCGADNPTVKVASAAKKVEICERCFQAQMPGAKTEDYKDHVADTLKEAIIAVHGQDLYDLNREAQHPKERHW